MENCSVVCIECKRETKHDILFGESIQKYYEEEEISWWAKYQVIRCRGCETVSFRKIHGSSEDYDPLTGEEFIYSEIYPEREYNRNYI